MIDDIILKVDLSRKKIAKQALSDSLKKAFIGGRGVNAKLLFDEVVPGTDAYSPRNVLIIGAGPLVGSGAPGSGRINVTARSPLTILGDSNAGGDWGPEMKFAGYSYIQIVGRSYNPVYLWIHDDEVELKDAKDLWGTDTWEAEQRIREENGVQNVKVASIGLAGENLVRYACVKFGNRTAGRCGLGGVMGSKRLKAIAVKGSRRRLNLADPKKFSEATSEAIETRVQTILKDQSDTPSHLPPFPLVARRPILAIITAAITKRWETLIASMVIVAVQGSPISFSSSAPPLEPTLIPKRTPALYMGM